MADLLYIPPLGGGIKDLAAAGQHTRLLEDYFRVYRKGFDRVYMLSFFDETIHDYQSSKIPADIEILGNKGGWHRYFFALFAPWIFRNKIKDVKLIRVSQTTGALPALFFRLWLQVPVVMTYGYDYVLFASIRGLVARWLARLHEWLGRMVADYWIVTLPGLGHLIQKRHGVSPENIWLVPNGVDLVQFLPRAPQNEPLRKLVFVGRLEAQKNLFTLIEYLTQLSQNSPLELSLVGAGSLEAELKKISLPPNLTLHFLGKLPHKRLPALLAQQHLFVSTSHFEGHPKAAIEAMAIGLPVLALATPGYAYFLKEAGQFFCACREDFFSAFYSLRDPKIRQDCGQKALNYVRTNCDIETNLALELGLLKSLVSESNHLVRGTL